MSRSMKRLFVGLCLLCPPHHDYGLFGSGVTRKMTVDPRDAVEARSRITQTCSLS